MMLSVALFLILQQAPTPTPAPAPATEQAPAVAPAKKAATPEVKPAPAAADTKPVADTKPATEVKPFAQEAAPAAAEAKAAPAPEAAPAPAKPASAAVAPVGEQLRTVRRVYVMPMGTSFDQYVANRLARRGVVQVVTDPFEADAVVTDMLGKSFETAFEKLFTVPETPEEKQAREEREKKDKEDDSGHGGMGNLTNVIVPERGSSFGRGKGNVYLVHRANKTVIWSAYLRPKTSRPDDLDRTAQRVADELSAVVSHQRKLEAKGK